MNYSNKDKNSKVISGLAIGIGVGEAIGVTFYTQFQWYDQNKLQ